MCLFFSTRLFGFVGSVTVQIWSGIVRIKGDFDNPIAARGEKKKE
jgi:hypothetical protein